MPFINTPTHEIFEGLNVEDDPTDIRPNETPDSRNTDISQEGELNTRPGIVRQNITALGNPVMETGYIDVADKVTKLVIVGGVLQIIV